MSIGVKAGGGGSGPVSGTEASLPYQGTERPLPGAPLEASGPHSRRRPPWPQRRSRGQSPAPRRFETRSGPSPPLVSSTPIRAWSLPLSSFPPLGVQTRKDRYKRSRGPLLPSKGYPDIAPAQPQAQAAAERSLFIGKRRSAPPPPGHVGLARAGVGLRSLRRGRQGHGQRGVLKQRVPHLHLSRLRRQASDEGGGDPGIR